jgi:CubicO group peptidase (beta-lactamase class C family)
VIEKAAGAPYEEFLQSAFFNPLQLGSLHHCKQAPQPPREASSYTLRKGRLGLARWENMNTARGDGGLCGNVVDLARWMRLLARGDVVGAASVDAMTRPTFPALGPTAPYGLGLGLLPLDGRHRISHTGEIGGFSAAAAYYPRDDLAIAVLSNLAGVPVEAIERAMARAVLDLPAPRIADLPVPDDLRRRLTGRWEIGIPGFVIEVVDGGNRLAVRMPPPGCSDELRYQGQGRFVSARVPDVQYVQLTEGEPLGALTVGMGDMHWDARRLAGRGAIQ